MKRLISELEGWRSVWVASGHNPTPVVGAKLHSARAHDTHVHVTVVDSLGEHSSVVEAGTSQAATSAAAVLNANLGLSLDEVGRLEFQSG